MRFCRTLFLLNLILTAFAACAQQQPKAFRIVPLGVKGGIDESNLSAYMVAAKGTNAYICLDAGTLHAGIEKAVALKTFAVPADQVLRQYIKAYFISHAHLDHLSGLIINSPDDTSKNIYSNAACIETIKTHYFTWSSWANFADDGEAPQLKKYHYEVMRRGVSVSVPNTAMEVQSFPLSHSNLESTAFLVRNNDSYLLYLGDTGPDEIEKSRNFHLLWQAIAPLVISKKLRAVMIEVSFPDEQPDKTLFGHLTPHWLMKEMDDLATLTGADALKGFNLVVTHVKPPQKNIEKLKRQVVAENKFDLKLKRQVVAENKFDLNLIFPEQGKAIEL